jgi:hypothetical protein
VLIFRKRQGVIVRVPTLALVLLGPWAMIEASRLVPSKLPPPPSLLLAAVVSAAFLMGFRIIRRRGDEIVMTGVLGGSRYVPARHAVLRVHVRLGARYGALALDLMPRPDLIVDIKGGHPDVVTIEDFEPNGTDAVMRAARRAASLLGLPEPMLGPGLIGSPGRTPQAGGAETRKHLDLPAIWAKARHAWAAASSVEKFVVVACTVSITWMSSMSFLQPSATLYLKCANRWHVRNPEPTFNFTCPDDYYVNVHVGSNGLDVWDPDRRCWIERTFVVPKNGARVDVDDTVKSGRCVHPDWPPP